ncbi:hypothetical protein [Photobacterium sp. Hal280]|uniref:hypothetical protein n=1 Tax=Photobacterium sp. Hal280 TaxID=3035163 RepID=UPI00301B8954
MMPGESGVAVMGRVTVAAVIGGTSSKLSGGKFENGAVTGAFSRLFNDEMHRDGFYERFKDNLRKAIYADIKIIDGVGQMVVGGLLIPTGYGSVPGGIIAFHGMSSIEEGITTLGSLIGLSSARNSVSEFWYSLTGSNKVYPSVDLVISLGSMAKVPLEITTKTNFISEVTYGDSRVKVTGSMPLYGQRQV